MAKNQSSFYMGNEFNGYGEVRYVKGTQTEIYSPLSQENVQLTPDFRELLLNVLGSNPAVIDPENMSAILCLAEGAAASVNHVIVKKDSNGNYILDFNVNHAHDLTDGSYPCASQTRSGKNFMDPGYQSDKQRKNGGNI